MKTHLTYLLVSALLLFSGSVAAWSRGNIYSIDDECFVKFEKAQDAIGTSSFKELGEQYLRLSVAKNDHKAITLYYVLYLKHYIAVGQDSDVDYSLENLKEHARLNGLMEYYYLGYTLASEYYFNKEQRLKSLDLMQKMEEDAIAFDDAYGNFLCHRFMGALCLRKNDYDSARDYFESTVMLYETSDDENIRSQGMTRIYTDLSDTYRYDNDTLKLCIDKALDVAVNSLDSLRANFYLAKYNAKEGNTSAYAKYKEICLGHEDFDRIFPEGRALFDFTDNLMSADWDKVYPELDDDNDFLFYKYASNMAHVAGNTDIENICLVHMLDIQNKVIQADNTMQRAEVGALIGSKELAKEVAEKTRRLNRTMFCLVAALLFILVGTVIFSFIYFRRVQKDNHMKYVMFRDLIHAKEEAERSTKKLTSFVQNMSHEIRTPLNAIVGFSQLLSLGSEMVSDEERAAYGRYIVNNSSVLTLLVDDLLGTSDIEQGKYKISKSWTDCNMVCSNAMQTAELRVQPGVKYELTTDLPEGYRIVSDPLRVQQILINFITNACKNTQEGSISLHVTNKVTPGFVTFAVSDTGPGVPPEKAEEIFERYVKLDQFKQGAGLGLSICRVVSQLLDGRVFLDKEYKAGARFVLELPDTQTL